MILLAVTLLTLLQLPSITEELGGSLKECPASSLNGDILGCMYNEEEVRQIIQENTTFHKDTECFVEHRNGVRNYRCNGESWLVIEDISTPLRSRGKRSWGRFWRSVGDFFIGVAKGVSCVLTLFSCLWAGRAGPIDNTQPAITCISPQPVIAEPYQTYAQVFYNAPSAHDETDGSITPVRLSGRPSGRHFPEGVTEITFEAKDRAGNRNACVVKISVIVIRCPTPERLENGYFQCHPVTEFLYGGGCHFGCYEGYDLDGNSDITCLNTSQWTGSFPKCIPWKCPELGSIPGAGFPHCTNNAFFRSICTYNCRLGFDMPAKVSKALVCDKSKTWRKCGEPKCIDVEPPQFETCPSLIIRGTDTGVNTTDVNWEEPKVKDNSGKFNLYIKEGERPGTKFQVGTHTIKYGATDDAGNYVVNDCSFTVIVRDIRCPKLYPTPYITFDCPDGYRSGARCDVHCDPGKSLVGSNDVGCLRSNEGLFADWNWKNGEQATCKNTLNCVQMMPPKNGAVACDNWEGGKFCQIQCRNGTEMSSVSLNKLYVCSQDGKWSLNPPAINTCREKRNPHLVLEASASYYTGDCSDKSTQQQIANNFIAAIKDSLYKSEVCPDSIECNNNNVQIFCGEASRRKRSVADIDSKNMTLTLEIRLPVSASRNANATDDNRFQKLLEDVKAVLKHREREIFANLTVTLHDFKSSGVDIVCPRGSVKSEQSLSCVDCPEGTAYVEKTGQNVCEACSKGFFQNETAQLSCNRCPERTTTRTVGSRSILDCEDACEAGTYSTAGLPPCTPCEQGSYQVSYGKTFCKPCPNSKTTLTFGAKSSLECKEFDIEMVNEEESNISLMFQYSIKMNDFTLGMWVQHEIQNNSKSNEENLRLVLRDESKEPLWTWNVFSGIRRQNCSDVTLPIELQDGRWHYLMLKSRLCKISVTIDGAPLPDSLSYGQCKTMSVKSLLMTSGMFSKISVSQLNIWDGMHSYVTNHRCFSTENGNVVSWKFFQEAQLSGAFLNLPSQCDDFNNCVSSPCLHGVCTDSLHDFNCACNLGFRGKQCDINIDDCEGNICMNNATCVDGIASFTCACAASYTGQYCEIEMVDGKWSAWGNWSECDTTCGTGVRKRIRLCNSPTPDNGGRDCVGDQFDYIDCNNTDCPVCPEIQAPGNGSLDCSNETGSINCTIACDEGYDFDIEPLPEYYCGPHTFHVWNFQTNENPQRRMPRCTAIQMPEELQVVYSAHYRDLYCASDILQEHAREVIDIAVKAVVTNVPCVRKQTCTLEVVEVIDCDKHSISKRSTMNTAGFSLEITSNPTEDDKNETLTDLNDAFQDIQDAANKGQMTVEVLDDEYQLDINTTSVSGKVVCSPGTTRVKFYCVPCGKGSYFYEDYCKPCPIGTFQSHEGRVSCDVCPSGTSTVGIRSTNEDDCTVKTQSDLQTGLKATGIIVGCVCGIAAIIAVVFVYRRYRSSKKKLVTPTDILNSPRPDSSLTNGHGELGPNNRRFESKTLISTNMLSSESGKFDSIPDSNEVVSPSQRSSQFELKRFNTFTSESGRVIHSKPWK